MSNKDELLEKKDELLFNYYLRARKLNWKLLDDMDSCEEVLNFYKKNGVLEIFFNVRPVILARMLRYITYNNITEISDEEISLLAYFTYSKNNIKYLMKFKH